VAFGNVDYYFQKALQSYLHISSYKRINKKDNSEEFVSELLQTKKVVNDAWSKNEFVYWERISKHLGEELFKEFTELLSELFHVKDITEKYSFMELRDEVMSRGMATKEEDRNTQKTKLDLFFDKLVLNKKSPLVVNFLHKNRRTEINKAPRIKVTVPISTEKVTKLSGEIIVPVTDDDIIKLNNHKGCATILDGGLVFIKGIFNDNELNVSNHTKVSEISTEKY
jgi:D-hexose-6-phosphate mutarotase